MTQTGYEVIEKAERSGATAEVLEWAYLGSAGTPDRQRVRNQPFSQAPVRQVRLTLKGHGAEFMLESGMLQFMKGRIDVQNDMRRAVGGFLSSMVSGEAVFRPTYRGVGEIWLEPSLGYFLLVELADEELIVDRGTFVACETSISVGASVQKNLSSAIFGGEGLFQTKLSGSGLAVLSSPVPEHELVKYTLERGEKASVDGNFAVLRSASVGFSVGKSARSWVGTATSGDGLLQTFDGPGDLWIAPTVPMYGLQRPVFAGILPPGQGQGRP